ncbi:hypothetical protein SCUCBS95973_006690 [Sporothrix curviconia]|uniref:Glycoside hydrolase family 5 domain-containing protein n=1 Tax=Sporothrix curviconia TaxID=1260050 RepID=A0ABP0C789_9PEZI
MLLTSLLLVGLAGLLGLVQGSPVDKDTSSASSSAAAWPNGPLVTSGRWIHDASGNNVTYAGANWPGAADTMLPEGLQYQSVDAIVAKIKGIGMNAIRLTYAIQMIDEIYANNGTDVTIEDALTKALGAANGQTVLKQIIKNNPAFTPTTTRLELFDAVAAACARSQIYVHLDNHISRAEWCCSTTDGNAWWGDTDFNVDKWVRGLTYMAKHAAAWPGLVSMSLRNEPRSPDDKGAAATAAKKTYNWQGWYKYVRQGADAIHAANPDVLIFLSGLGYDTDLSAVVRGSALSPGTDKFRVDDFAADGGSSYGASKLVLELHNYQNSATSCSSLESGLTNGGFSAMTSGGGLQMPVVMTEFGFMMDTSTYKGVYASCLASFLPRIHAGWTIWVLSGSYYIRSGKQDFDETWGLLNHDWSAWRSPAYVTNQLQPMIKASLGT